MSKSISLRARFTILFSILIILLSAFLSFAIGIKSSKEVREEIGSSLAETSFQMADKLDHYMWSRSGEIDILKELEQLKESNDYDAIQALLNRLKTSFPSFSWIGFTDPKGTVRAATDGILVGTDISKRPVYQEGIKGDFIGDVHDAVLLAKLLPNPSGEPMKFVDISKPVYGKEGKLAGVLAAHLSWKWAAEIEKSIMEPLKNRKDIEVFIVSEKDNAILLGPREMIGQKMELDSINEARTGKNNWALETWPNGKEYLTGFGFADGYMNYRGLGWTILVRQPVDIAYSSVEKLQIFILFLGAGFTTAFGAIAWLMTSRVVKPLKEITSAANLLSEGQDVDIPKHIGIREIEILSDSLRKLVESLTDTENALGKMKNLAHHDRLTGLPNRLALDYFVKKAKIKAKREGLTLTFLYMDLDGFKTVNDTLGHNAGDEVLKEVAARLKLNIRGDEIVVRLGGDEFVMVLYTSMQHPIDNAKVVALRVIKALNEPFVLEEGEARIGCSIGGSVWPIDAQEVSDILSLADETLYVSKRSGKNQVNFSGINMNKINYEKI